MKWKAKEQQEDRSRETERFLILETDFFFSNKIADHSHIHLQLTVAEKETLLPANLD